MKKSGNYINKDELLKNYKNFLVISNKGNSDEINQLVDEMCKGFERAINNQSVIQLFYT